MSCSAKKKKNFVRNLEYRVGKMSKGATAISAADEKQSGGTVHASLRAEFTRHMNLLPKSCFADVDEYFVGETDPYISSLDDVEYLRCEDELADLQDDSVSKNNFQENECKMFWIVKGHAVAPRLAEHAVTRFILAFSITYLSETAFSALVTIKTKARNRLDVHQDFRLTVTSITPDITY